MKKRFSEEQIIGFLREAEAGMPVKDLCRRHGFSDASYYLWRSKFGGMSVPDAKRLTELEAQNTWLPIRPWRFATVLALGAHGGQRGYAPVKAGQLDQDGRLDRPPSLKAESFLPC